MEGKRGSGDTGSVTLAVMCCALTLHIVELTLGLVLIYLGAHFQDVECDQPLATYLILMGVCAMLTQFGTMFTAGFRKLHGDSANGENSAAAAVGTCGAVLCSATLACNALFGFVLFILGNVWVFSSETCHRTAESQLVRPRVALVPAPGVEKCMRLARRPTLHHPGSAPPRSGSGGVCTTGPSSSSWSWTCSQASPSASPAASPPPWPWAPSRPRGLRRRAFPSCPSAHRRRGTPTAPARPQAPSRRVQDKGQGPETELTAALEPHRAQMH